MNCEATLKVRVRSLSVTCDRVTAVMILGRLQAMLPLLAALEQIADAEVKLRCIVEVVGAELTRLEDRQKLRVAQQHRIRPQIGRCFFRLALLDRGARGQQIVIVLKSHLNGIVKRNGLCARLLRECICLRGGLWRALSGRRLRTCGLEKGYCRQTRMGSRDIANA